ncbi:hypothetical protein [Siccirubricoccus phaeus]|uniref:hypothetical protein n=1 Tax=Siccirubricoccus phaeus TaxID=2595053 RepID=UPI0011F10562|nr:hypothetical protein [Siccirubricoccus phaeus]
MLTTPTIAMRLASDDEGANPTRPGRFTLKEEDAAVWDWNPAVDERVTGRNPVVVLLNLGVIAAPASITAETPRTTAFAVLVVCRAAVGSRIVGLERGSGIGALPQLQQPLPKRAVPGRVKTCTGLRPTRAE